MVAKNYCTNLKFNSSEEHLNHLKGFVEEPVFPNLYKMLHLAVSIPISSVCCDRSFSVMRRIRNYICSTMSQDRFSKLSILCIERELSNKINTANIIDAFA